MASVTFVGAAQEVTGSCYLLDTGSRKFLLDCGIRQGGDDVGHLNKARFPFQPESIHAVLLSHAHLDHSGMLPRLVHEGFAGPIFCTPATRNQLAVMLEDAVGLYLRDLEWENRQRQRGGKDELLPQYTMEDVARVLELCEPVEYGVCHKIAGDVELCFHDAGHILGSAIVEVKVGGNSNKRTLVFSGDLGANDTVLMTEPAKLETADVVLMEGTYGNRNHRPRDETIEELAQVLADAWKEGGNVLIPAFAVGRTQDLLFTLGLLHHEGRLDRWQIFLDSPMAIEVTRIYDQWFDHLDRHDISLMRRHRGKTLEAFLPGLRLTSSVEESMAINRIARGAIVIAGSGMCSGGRIRHHLKQRLWKKDTRLVFVGFQARGTLGRALVDGARSVRMFGQHYAVNAQVHTLGGFSAHAGQDELVAWAANFCNKPRFNLVHGEPEALQALAERLWREKRIAAEIPVAGMTITL